MSRTYREFGDLLSAYNEANEKWMPIQKAYELLDSVNENEIWEQRHAAADALFKYIAKLEAEVTKCHELQDSYCDRIAELEGELEHVIEVGNYGWDVIRKYGWEEKEINWWNTASDKAYKCLRKGK